LIELSVRPTCNSFPILSGQIFRPYFRRVNFRRFVPAFRLSPQLLVKLWARRSFDPKGVRSWDFDRWKPNVFFLGFYCYDTQYEVLQVEAVDGRERGSVAVFPRIVLPA
jgi:hypothetical protein